MALLYLVRHGPTAVDPTLPQDQWHLSKEGVDVVRDWAKSQSWTGVDQLYASPELKARETADIVGEVAKVPVGIDEGLRELGVPFIASRSQFLDRMERYLAGFPDPEFEPWEAAQERMASSIDTIQARHPGESIALVSHGRILTAFLSRILGRRLTRDEWLAIQMPDVAIVDLPAGFLTRRFAGWTVGRA